MGKIILLFMVVLLLAGPAGAQWVESFGDGDLGRDPAWMGTTGKWKVVPKSDVGVGAVSGTLRLEAPAGAGVAWLSTQVNGSWGVEQTWSFWIGRRGQAAGAWNVGFFWLYASEADVASGTVDGYRVRYGDDLPSGDHVVLESVRDGSAAPLINSIDQVPEGLTDYGIQVRVTRTAAGLWTLYTSPLPQMPGTGAVATSEAADANVCQGARVDTTYTRFDDGYISVATLYTNTPAARTGIEFDQLQCSGGGFMDRAGREGSAKDKDNNALTEADRLPAQKDSAEVSSTRDRENELTNKISIDRVLSPQLRAYPNPLHGRSLHVAAGMRCAGRYQVQAWSAAGVLITGTNVDHKGGVFDCVIELPVLSSGIYWLSLSGDAPVLNKGDGKAPTRSAYRTICAQTKFFVQ